MQFSLFESDETLGLNWPSGGNPFQQGSGGIGQPATGTIYTDPTNPHGNTPRDQTPVEKWGWLVGAGVLFILLLKR